MSSYAWIVIAKPKQERLMHIDLIDGYISVIANLINLTKNDSVIPAPFMRSFSLEEKEGSPITLNRVS